MDNLFAYALVLFIVYILTMVILTFFILFKKGKSLYNIIIYSIVQIFVSINAVLIFTSSETGIGGKVTGVLLVILGISNIFLKKKENSALKSISNFLEKISKSKITLPYFLEGISNEVLAKLIAVILIYASFINTWILYW